MVFSCWANFTWLSFVSWDKKQPKIQCSHDIFVIYPKFQKNGGAGENANQFLIKSHHFDVKFVCVAKSDHSYH
jgi:hypothetical protein